MEAWLATGSGALQPLIPTIHPTVLTRLGVKGGEKSGRVAEQKCTT